MDVMRIGDKVISRKKLYMIIDKALDLRSEGLSQQEIANIMGLDRPFISKLEKLGEIRKGQKIGVVAFPIENKQELEQYLKKEGVDFMLLMTDDERWGFVREKQGIELFNGVMEIIAQLRSCDVIIVIGSNYRIKLCEALVDKEVIGIEIGKSPIEADKLIDMQIVQNVFSTLNPR